MYGAILGDMIGVPFEFGNKKTKDFELFTRNTHFSDDTVMTIAVADALLRIPRDADEKTVKCAVVKSMRRWGAKYPYAGYGGTFGRWLTTPNPQPYNSWGNGAAMRISSVGWLYDNLARTREVAKWVTEVTHNHPEGIKGAQCTAEAIYMARTKEISHRTKSSMKRRLAPKYRYNLNRMCDKIRPNHDFDVSCQATVPEALICFFEGKDYEDTIRNAISLGGDTDTLACIAGSIAEAYWEVPTFLKNECWKRLPSDMKKVMLKFSQEIGV